MVVMHGVQTPCIKSQVIDNIYYSIFIISLIMGFTCGMSQMGHTKDLCQRHKYMLDNT